MHSNNPENSKTRFQAVFDALDRHEDLQNRLNQIDQLNSTLNDDYLGNLLENTNEINGILANPALSGSKYQNLLEQAVELGNILSLSGRVNECIAESERFQDAIELLELIDYVHKKCDQQVPLVESIYKESELQRDRLLNKLSSKLESLQDAPQGEVTTLVNCLSRCGNFAARDLRLKYLQARDNWFNNLCKQQGNSFDRLVSVYCHGLTSIYEEYRSIFSDSNEYLDKGYLTTISGNKEDGAIINSWLLLKTSIFVASLEAYLKTCEQSGVLTPTNLADTMDKCFVLSRQFSPIGFDFSAQLRPLFLKALKLEVKSSIERASQNFELAFTTIVSKSIESLLLPIDDEILRISNMKPEQQLPGSIDHYPVLKIYCLHILDSLRWIQTTKRVVTPTSLCLDTYASMNASLTRVMKALAVVLNTDNNSNHPILSKIAISFLTEVLPFLANYCELLFPEKVVLNAIGLSKTEFKNICMNEPDKLKNFRLDLRQAAEPLKSTMPALMQTLENL